MLSRMLAISVLLGALVSLTPMSAQDAKDRLREKLKDAAAGESWIYDDINAGFAEAKQTGKPMLVVFR